MNQSEHDIAAIRERLDAEAWEAYHGRDWPDAYSPEGRSAINNIMEELLCGDASDILDSVTDGLVEGLSPGYLPPIEETDAEREARWARALRVDRDLRALGGAILHGDESAAGAVVVRLVRAYVADVARRKYERDER